MQSFLFAVRAEFPNFPDIRSVIYWCVLNILAVFQLRCVMCCVRRQFWIQCSVQSTHKQNSFSGGSFSRAMFVCLCIFRFYLVSWARTVSSHRTTCVPVHMPPHGWYTFQELLHVCEGQRTLTDPLWNRALDMGWARWRQHHFALLECWIDWVHECWVNVHWLRSDWFALCR